jgi:hypothetical protein
MSKLAVSSLVTGIRESDQSPQIKDGHVRGNKKTEGGKYIGVAPWQRWLQ